MSEKKRIKFSKRLLWIIPLSLVTGGLVIAYMLILVGYADLKKK